MTTERVPTIATRNDVPFVNRQTKFRIKGAPVTASKDGDFIPESVLLTEWPDMAGKAHVKVSAPTAYRHGRSWPYTKQFNVRGCNYEPTPEWLRVILRAAGYRGDFDD